MATRTAQGAGAPPSTPAYNPKRDLVRGETLIIFLAGKPIAFGKKDDFSFTPEMQEVSNKWSGKYADKLPGTVNWKISCEAMLTRQEGFMSAEQFVNLAGNGSSSLVEFVIGCRVHEQGGNKRIVPGTRLYYGQAVITDYSESSSHGEIQTFNATLEGNGALYTDKGQEVGSDEALALLQLTPEELQKSYTERYGQPSSTGA